MTPRLFPAALAAGLCLFAQQPAPLSNQDAFDLYGRAVELMESTSLVSPELARAGAPIIENARQAVTTLRSLNRQHAGVTYTFLGNLRAYLALADALPKPGAFAGQTTAQFTELRQVFERADANFRVLIESKEAQLRNPDRDSLARYASANAQLGPPHPDQPRVVFLGDSITDLWRLNEYFPARDFVNRGIAGQIADEMLGRVEADVVALHPAAMLLLAGTNDIARGVPLDIVENNLKAIAELAQSHGIKPLLASVLPAGETRPDHPPGAILALNGWIENLCRQRNYFYVDYFTAMTGPDGRLRPDLSDDGLHPNSLGYRVMAPIALAAIAKAAPTPPRPKSKLRHPPSPAR
ncbi:MAG: GDSL-type esterase/lipase family protein [Bryobacteraceae bacterium]